MKDRPNSKNNFNSLCQLIPGGVNSPVRACKGLIDPPMIVERGEADCIYDIDHHKYIDYCGSWGALIHGHAHPEILKAVDRRMRMGTTFGISTVIEEEMARKVVSIFPSIEKIRFVSSGTEATMTVARLARGFTQRDLIVKFSGNYHGHADFFLIRAGSGVSKISPTSSSAGIPQDIIQNTICLPYNDIEALKALFSDEAVSKKIAAVILEPIAGNMGLVAANPQWLHLLRELTSQHGSLLIFDEVITGFRVGLKGAQGLYGITPDLTCLGKIVGGGFPAAAFGGRNEIMDHLAPLGPVYQAGTLSGNPVAMEAGLQAIKMLEVPGFYEELERKSHILTKPIQELIKELDLNACVQQVGSMFTLFFGAKKVDNFEEALKIPQKPFVDFFRYMFERGVYIPPSAHEAWFVSTVHSEEHLRYTADIILEFLEKHFVPYSEESLTLV